MNAIIQRGYKLPLIIAIVVALAVTFNPFKSKQETDLVNLSAEENSGAKLAGEASISDKIHNKSKQAKTKMITPEKAEVIAIAKHYQEAFRANPRSISRLLKIRPAIESHHVGFVIEPGKEKGHFEQLGLQLGDIITEINGVEVSNLAAMQKMITEFGTAKSLELSLVRNDAPVTVRYEIN